jgi:hypothetical protein
MSNKTKRMIFFLLSLIIPIGIPLVVVLIQYDVLKLYTEASTTVKVSIIAAIFIVSLFIALYNKIRKFLNEMEFSLVKCLINGIVKMIPLVCILLVFANMYKVIDDIVFVMEWIIPCAAVSLFYFEPKYHYYTKLCKEDEQIRIIRKAIK